MKTIAILSLILYAYSIYCIIRELVLVNKESMISEKHKRVNISILIYNLVGCLFLIYWIFSRRGFEHAFYINIIKQDFWLFLLISAQITTSMTRNIRKIRTGEDLVLNYKKEIKRTVTFSFTKKKEFEKLKQNFLAMKKAEGKDAFVIDTAKANIEPYKYLSNGTSVYFGSKTVLEKVGDEIANNYLYHNETPLVFELHNHINLKETITPLISDIDLYLIVKDEIVHKVIKLNERYTIPKGVFHGAMFSEPNKIRLKWT